MCANSPGYAQTVVQYRVRASIRLGDWALIQYTFIALLLLWRLICCLTDARGGRGQFRAGTREPACSGRPKQQGEIAAKVVDALFRDRGAPGCLRQNESSLNDTLHMTGETLGGDRLSHSVFPHRVLDI